MRLDIIDKKLLNLLQAEFPLQPRPYSELGLKLGIDEDEVIQRIRQLKANGIIRQISPVLDARSLGYQITLVTMRVAGSQLGKAAQLIIKHMGVSHVYEREHHFNLWFTLAIPSIADMETELKGLTSPIDVEAVFALSAVTLFKIGAYFTMDENGQTAAGTVALLGEVLLREAELSQADRLIINELQQDLPLTQSPFAAIAARVGMDEENFLAQCQSLLHRGIMRRFGAAINHNSAGFKAREVSHCYERKTNPIWPYNLFAMIHGHTRESCREIARKAADETGLTDYVLLFSTREFKKTRVKYLV